MDFKSFFKRSTIKASQVVSTDDSTQTNPFLTFQSKQHQEDHSPQNLVKMNTGWVSVCNGKNSATCASIPLKLYYKNSTGKDPQITRFKHIDKKLIKNICKSANLELKQKETIEEILDHPLLKLFESINDTMNYYDWCELNFEYLGLIGNSYNEIVYKDNIPISLSPLLSEYVVPVANGKIQGDISGYLYKPENKEYKFKPEQILHFAQYAPGNTLIGRGDLETCMNAQERYCYYDQYEKFLGINNCRPDWLLNLKAPKISEKDLKDYYRQLMKRFGSVKNSGKPIIVAGDMDVKNLGFAPKDLQFQVGRQWSLKEIAGSFGVPEALVTVQDVNRANAVESTNQYLRYTIYPKMVKYCSKINEVLTPKYDTSLFVWFEEQYLENPVEKITNTIAAYSAGIVDRNEARSAMGYEPVENIDENTTDTTTTMPSE